MKRVKIAFLPYVGEEIKEEKYGLNGKEGLTSGDLDKIFVILMEDLVERAKEYGVPKDTLDWYSKLSDTDVAEWRENGHLS